MIGTLRRACLDHVIVAERHPRSVLRAFVTYGNHDRPQLRGWPRALDPEQVEAVLRGIRDVRDRALLWPTYDGGLRCQEALAIDLEDVDWAERASRLQGKRNRPREMLFSRRVSRY